MKSLAGEKDLLIIKPLAPRGSIAGAPYDTGTTLDNMVPLNPFCCLLNLVW